MRIIVNHVIPCHYAIWHANALPKSGSGGGGGDPGGRQRLRPLQVGNATDQQGKGTGLKELQVTNWHGGPISKVCGAQIP
jgi:hypothetical protein